MIIESIQQDHANLTKLLDALERQLRLFDAGRQPDEDVLRGVVDYCLDYPETHHHPLEDLIYEALQRRRGGKGGDFDLPGEHEKLSRQTQHFAEAVNAMLQGAEMPRENFNRAARGFLEGYRRHMELEDKRFLPAALAELTEADWAEIEARAVRREDPLVSPEGRARYRALCDDILAWDREDAERGQ